jgi:tRNA-2-methylthio-N6-dimethylallyladenosine synthase
MNEHDSQVLAGLLEERGFESAGRPEDADLVVFNTCCVRDTAERRVLGRIGLAKAWKKQRPGMIVAVAGCMTQQHGMADTLRARAPHVDLVVGTHNLRRLPDLVDLCLEEGRPLVEVIPAARAGASLPEDAPPRRSKRTDGLKAWVAISHGCDNNCSYCIVPHVRGPERSRRPSAIVAEVTELAAAGCREVTLLGQNVNSYPDFAALISAVNMVDGIWRIRYMTSHPRDFTDRLIAAIASSDKVCEHFHLPAQSGSDRILEAMNRGYSKDYYLKLLDRVRAAVSRPAVTTDIITGFPGETEDDFEETLDLVRRAQFDGAFTFLYSPRRGTPAASLPDQVPLEVRKERLSRLIETQKEVSLAINQRLLGRRLEILVEGPGDGGPGTLVGRTRTNKLAVIPAGSAAVGQLVDVTIERAGHWTLEGRP